MDAKDPASLAALAALIAIDLPQPCEAGVRTNLTLLAEHWRGVEEFEIPEDAL